MSVFNSQGGFLIDCRECDSPDCRGCNLYTLATALRQGKLDWAMDNHRGIDTDRLKMPELRIEPLESEKAFDLMRETKRLLLEVAETMIQDYKEAIAENETK